MRGQDFFICTGFFYDASLTIAVGVQCGNSLNKLNMYRLGEMKKDANVLHTLGLRLVIELIKCSPVLRSNKFCVCPSTRKGDFQWP